MFTTVYLPPDCANLACPNKPEEGAFVLLQTEDNVVGDKRPLRLWICSPCARALSQGIA